MTNTSNLNMPWTLHFDHDGTDDVAIIVDAKGEDLVTSHEFWLPEAGDPIPPSLAGVRVMFAAPDLLEALEELLDQTVEMDAKYGVALSEGERAARDKALKAITKARS